VVVIDQSAASDTVELLDDGGRPSGAMGKAAAHEPPGRLHRGFSVILFDETGRVLLQRRADSKYHFAGRWSNACCSHPPAGADVAIAARKRLLLELRIEAALEVVGSFRYVAVDEASMLVEREDDVVLVGYVLSDVVVEPNRDEVSATRFVGIRELESQLASSAVEFTPWLAEALQCAVKAGHPKHG
jgi:isopentenyl-diphosphate delta-isomerase